MPAAVFHERSLQKDAFLLIFPVIFRRFDRILPKIRDTMVFSTKNS